MFDDDQSVLDFLDQGRKRFQDNADPRQLVATHRYMKFPSDRTRDNQDETKLPAVIADGHAKGKSCPAKDGKGPVPSGSIVARVVGRALDRQGKPLADVVKQEHYVEDQFAVTPEVQKRLLKALADAGTERIRLPDDFGKVCATHAHLGHID